MLVFVQKEQKSCVQHKSNQQNFHPTAVVSLHYTEWFKLHVTRVEWYWTALRLPHTPIHM